MKLSVAGFSSVSKRRKRQSPWMLWRNLQFLRIELIFDCFYTFLVLGNVQERNEALDAELNHKVLKVSIKRVK